MRARSPSARRPGSLGLRPDRGSARRPPGSAGSRCPCPVGPRGSGSSGSASAGLLGPASSAAAWAVAPARPPALALYAGPFWWAPWCTAVADTGFVLVSDRAPRAARNRCQSLVKLECGLEGLRRRFPGEGARRGPPSAAFVSGERRGAQPCAGSRPLLRGDRVPASPAWRGCRRVLAVGGTETSAGSCARG